MSAAEIQIIDSGASKMLDTLHGVVAPGKRRDLMLTLGRDAESEYRAWFLAHNDTPNAKGFPRSFFWRKEIAEKTNLDESRTDDNAATIVIANRAINAHVHGGTWGPRPGKKNLALPLRGDAYGKNPRDNPIAGAFFLRTKAGKNLIVKREGGKIVPLWRLVPYVHVTRDPAALPPTGMVARAILQTARSYVSRNSKSQ